MTISLAFDVYGTMIDTTGVVNVLEGIVGDQTGALSQVYIGAGVLPEGEVSGLISSVSTVRELIDEMVSG